MSVHQIRRALEPDLRVHAISKCLKGVLHGNTSWALQYAMAAGLERVLQKPGEDSLERRLLVFLESGGVIIYVKDGSEVIGAATVGHCVGLRDESFLTQDFCIAKRITVLHDRVYRALLNGILGVAHMNSSKTNGGPVLVQVGAATSERRLLEQIFREHGFQEMAAQPGMWIARVKHGQEQLAVA